MMPSEIEEERLTGETAEVLLTVDGSSDNSPPAQWESNVKKLQEKEKKLIDKYNQVLSNLYLLPGYVLAVTSGVSGLLSTEPHFCLLFVTVVVVIAIFLVALYFSVRFAYQQLKGLHAKMKKLASKRTNLHDSSEQHVRSSRTGTQINPILLEKLKNFERKKPELEFQTQHYDKFVHLIIVCGLFYAVTLLVAAYYVLCDSKPVPCTPCTPCTLHTRLHSEL